MEGPGTRTESTQACENERRNEMDNINTMGPMQVQHERSEDQTKNAQLKGTRWSLARVIKHLCDVFMSIVLASERSWFQFLVGFHYAGFQRNGKIEYLQKAIDNCTRAVELTPEDHPGLPLQLNNLAMYHRARFLSLGELDDLEMAITTISQALALAPNNYAFMPKMLNNLGLFYSNRFERLGSLDDLQKAIEYGTRAVDLAPQIHPDLPMQLTDLGIAYRTRFQRQGELDDLERAIAHISRAVALTPESHPSLPLWLSNLGLTYSNRFDRLGNLDDLEKAIQYGTRTISLAPDGHPDLPMLLNNLGLAYRAQYLRQGESDDLERAIAHISRAVTLTPDGHSYLPLWLSNLGIVYSSRFDRLGGSEDLEKAIAYGIRAVDLTPADHPSLPLRLSNQGISYHSRFVRLGELDDLEQAISLTSRAVSLAPDEHPSLPLWLSNLGWCHSERFDRLGGFSDLENSIKYGTRAVDQTPDDHPDLPMRLTNLGVTYHARFQHQGELDDLEQAIALMTRVISLVPDSHSSLPRWLSNLGRCYSSRFDRLGSLDDLDKAVEYGTRAVDLTPGGHPNLPIMLNNLGMFYHTRFLRLGAPGDLEKSFEHLSRAFGSTPDDHPKLSSIFRRLGTTGVSEYQRTGDPSHLQKSLSSFRKACQLSTGPPRERFRCALAWAELSASHNGLNCMEAYQNTMDLLPQFIWLGASTTQRYQDLTTVENLARNAAGAAILHSDTALALEWLEHGRCVVWSQSLILRSPLDLLHSSHPELGARLQVVTKHLQDANSDVSELQPSTSDSYNPEQAGRERRRLAKEYDSLLTQARILPGFADFLCPMKANGLISAARNGPVIVINCHELRCDALIILPGRGTIEHLPLPEYNQNKALEARSKLEISLDYSNLRQRGVKVLLTPDHKGSFGNILLDLWRYIVKPVLDYLELKDDRPIESLPHITWCPTGAMTFLPLHAAGDYERPQSCVFDYAVSSYTPTLTALLGSTPSTLTRKPRVLAIGQTNTPGQNPLPGTATELEVVKNRTRSKAEYAQLTDSQATVEAVLDVMEQYDWVHLACHAHQNVNDPTKSGFFLHDGTLDLASINRRSFKNKGLAFLSACQTATGDEKLPDEAIHLASGMLMAGYPSVIATMWAVMDDDAPFVADKVYDRLMRDGKVGDGEAGRALHQAVAELRNKVGKKEFGRWVPYIHIGS